MTAKPPTPLYTPEHAKAAFHLRYSWTGWPTSGEIPNVDLESIKPLWETDGLRLLETSQNTNEIKLAFSATPAVSPVFLAARAKGRLQHAIRSSALPFAGFSRKVSVRSIGDNTTQNIEKYIARQVAKGRFADERFATMMSEFTTADPMVDLDKPSETAAGRYWYNLHLVLEAAERLRTCDRKSLTIIRDGASLIATKKGYAVACLSVMPDHLHLAQRGNVEHSPQEIALCFQNNLAYRLGQVRAWSGSFYVGTFGKYDFGAIRAAVKRSCHPTGLAPVVKKIDG